MISSSVVHMMESNSTGASELQSVACFLQHISPGIRIVLILKQKYMQNPTMNRGEAKHVFAQLTSLGSQETT